MKPLVYLLENVNDGNVILPIDEFKKMINEIYMNGFTDGQNYNYKIYNTPYITTNPCIVPNSLNQWATETHSSDCSKSEATLDNSLHVTGHVNTCVTEIDSKS